VKAGIFRLLYEALRNVAADAGAQVNLLETDALWHIDEFALDYNHAAQAAVRQGLLTEPQARAVLALDGLFDQMSGESNARLWTTEALQTAPEWRRARTLATEAIRSLPPESERSP
jgi:hypothetical protein